MRFFLFFAIALFSTRSFSADGLVIHATEMGVAKFHRYDNTVHPYEAGNAWGPYILPKDAGKDTPLVVENADKSFTIFFSTLEEMLKQAVQISQQKGEKIAVLNLHGHGLPGGMWFPPTESAKNNFGCWQWVSAAAGEDKENYDQYYTPVSKEDVLSIRKYSQTGGSVPCVTGLSQWKTVLNSVPTFKNTLAPHLQFNFLSCVVGLGPVGAKFTEGLGALLTASDQVRLNSSMYFGLGDWSMGEGMGFWDYQNDAQLKHDNSIYPVTRKDREIMQKGDVRVSALLNGKWDSKVGKNLDFMVLTPERELNDLALANDERDLSVQRPSSIRIVGTDVRLPVQE